MGIVTTKTSSIVVTEMVTHKHPDKMCDWISDAILMECIKQDPNSRVACETTWKGTTVVLAGEITTTANVDYEEIVQEVAAEASYPVDNILNLITTQSPEIHHAVDSTELCAGDQGIMFGYACKGENYLPTGINVCNKIIDRLENLVQDRKLLQGDAKCQIVCDDGWIKDILVSTCFRKEQIGEGAGQVSFKEANQFLFDYLYEIKEISQSKPTFTINPSGLWTFGGPAADCGLTGRKIVCDQYGGYAPVGGGALSGKDLTKVDRSGAYLARHLAVTVLRNFSDLDECRVQLSYAIGIPVPQSVSVIAQKKGLFGTKAYDFSDYITKNFDLSVAGAIEWLNSLNLDWAKVSQGNHMKWIQ